MSIEPLLNYEFGPFRLCVNDRLLMRGDQVVHLTPKQVDMLIVLVENSGHVVTKDVLMSTLWPNTFVEENSLTQNISLLRKALADDRGEYIETIPKRGYRFVGQVRKTSSTRQELVMHERMTTQVHIEERVGPDSREPQAAAKGALGDYDGRRRWRVQAYAAIVAGCVVIAVGIYVIRLWNVAASSNFQPVHFASLTSLGKVTEGAVSSDGKYIAYVALEDDKQSVWVKEVETDSSIRIVPPESSNCIGLKFSPDGNQILYTTYPENSNVGLLFQVSVLGGTKHKLIENIDSPPSFSPDGNQLAFLRRSVSSASVEHSLIIANSDGQGQRKLSMRTGPDFYSWKGPAWSPDGKTLVTGAGTIKDIHITGLVEINLDDGREKSISSRTWTLVDAIAWLPNKTGLFVVASDSTTEGLMQIWHVAYPSGEAQRITKDLNHYNGLSLSSDSSRLVTIQSDRILNMFVSSEDNRANAKELTLASGGRLCGNLGIAITPDRRIVYSSATGGNTDIWIMHADGTQQKRLTYDQGQDFLPTVAPDGRRILFLSNRTGTQQLWTMNIDGQQQTQLTDGDMKYRPRWSPDGKWIVYTAMEVPGTKPTVWKVSADGGHSMQLTKKYSRLPVVSPDGRFIACYYWDDVRSRMNVAIIPFDGGEPVKILETPDGKHHWSLQWSPDGRGLLHVQARRVSSTIWRLPLDNGPSEKILDVAGQIVDFAISPDGKDLIYARAILNSDVVVVTGFK